MCSCIAHKPGARPPSARLLLLTVRSLLPLQRVAECCRVLQTVAETRHSHCLQGFAEERQMWRARVGVNLRGTRVIVPPPRSHAD